jgi:Calcineurin-like phosphoesterase.
MYIAGLGGKSCFMTVPTYVVGDIHGHLQVLERLLRQGNLVDKALHWSGGDAVLWFIGDLVDRGPDSIAVIDFVMRLQMEAALVGGYVDSLLGNHELLMLAAYRFGQYSNGCSSSFIGQWRRNGGVKSDLAKLTEAHLIWLAERPPLARIGNNLLVHADATFYTRYGHSLAAINNTFRALCKRSDVLAWEEMIEAFSTRNVFMDGCTGEEFINRFLMILGGRRIIHGHTPISTIIGGSAVDVVQPYTYANGRCLNVDGGIYLGCPGFIHKL